MLKDSERVTVRKSVLLIRNVGAHDAGFYMCFANSTAGSDRLRIHVVSKKMICFYEKLEFTIISIKEKIAVVSSAVENFVCQILKLRKISGFWFQFGWKFHVLNSKMMRNLGSGF